MLTIRRCIFINYLPFKKISLCLLILFQCSNSVKGQHLDFDKYYFAYLAPNLTCYDFIKTSDNGFLMTGEIVGFNSTYFLMKIDEFGDTVWLKLPPGGSTWTTGIALKELSNGNYALLCTEYLSKQSLLLLIFDTTGNVLFSNSFRNNGNLYITNISESNGNLFLLGQRHGGVTESYLLKTNLMGDSISCRIDTTFLIANHNNSVYFNGSQFVVVGTSRDTTGTFIPVVEKLDTSGNIIWRVDYPQFAESTGSQLFQYHDGYIASSISPTIGNSFFMIDSIGNMIWDNHVGQNYYQITSPDNSRILIATSNISLNWFDSSGAFINSQFYPLALSGWSFLSNSLVHNQQLYLSGTVQTGSSPLYSSAFFVRLTDSSLVSTHDLLNSKSSYIYPTICSTGSYVYFHNTVNNFGNIKITLYNALGEIMESRVVSARNLNSDSIIKLPDSLSSGLYFLKIISSNSNNTFRFIIH